MDNELIISYLDDLENYISLLSCVKCNNTRLVVIESLKEKIKLLREELEKESRPMEGHDIHILTEVSL
jgi:hypothetical protein